MDLQLVRLEQLLAQRGLQLDVTPEARELLAEQGYDPVYGARPLKRVIQRELQNRIALELLEGSFKRGRHHPGRARRQTLKLVPASRDPRAGECVGARRPPAT